jgi:hypothetical protein
LGNEYTLQVLREAVARRERDEVPSTKRRPETVAEWLVLAAAELERLGWDWFGPARLAEAAYRLCPQGFAAGGESDPRPYPSDNKVVATLCHNTGPFRKGWMQRRAGEYSLTPRGRQVLKGLTTTE